MIRIGFAKDIHQLEEGDYLLLGGIKIPSKNRIIAHSDGDVVLHAVSESLLGSLSLGDFFSLVIKDIIADVIILAAFLRRLIIVVHNLFIVTTTLSHLSPSVNTSLLDTISTNSNCIFLISSLYELHTSYIYDCS